MQQLQERGQTKDGAELKSCCPVSEVVTLKMRKDVFITCVRVSVCLVRVCVVCQCLCICVRFCVHVSVRVCAHVCAFVLCACCVFVCVFLCAC